MIWVVVLALIGGCVSTPLPQGNLKIVKYTANRDGLFPQNDGIPIAPQPIIYNPQQPYLIQEPSPLTYSAVGGSVLTERDQQRHINIDDEVEAKEEGADDESKPVEEPKVDTNVDSKDESVVSVDDQKPVQTETAALVGSNVLPVKGGVQSFGIGNDQIFPSVITGQRRLIESQPLLYNVKGKIPSLIPSYHQVVPQQRVVYHSVQQQQQYPVNQVPIHVEEQKISPHGVQVRKPVPVIQYQQVQPVQKPFVPREWLRKPIQQGVKGHQQVQQHQQQIQYFIQPVISSDFGLPVDQSQVLGVQPNYQGVKIVQRQDEINKVNAPKGQGVDQVNVPVGNVQDRDDQSGVQDLVGLSVQQQQQQPRQDALNQKQGVKSPVDHSVLKVVVQSSQQQVPVVGQPQVIGYQLVGQQPQQILVQQPIQHLVSPISQQNVQYFPISDIQRYYQLIQSVPLQSIGQQYGYIQSPQLIDQQIQYTSGQVSQNGQPLQSQVVQPIDQNVGVVGGVHGSQRVFGYGVPQNQEDRSGVKGQNSAPVDQRRQRSFIGVKGGINV